MSPSTFFVAAAAALVVAASAADPIKFDGYAVDVACVSSTGSKSFDKGVSVLAKPEEHTKYCLMMSYCIKDLVLLEAPATAGSDYTIKYHLAADLLAVAAAQIKASDKTADIKVQVEGCLTGATTDITPGGGAKQSVPILGKCPTDATATAAPGAGNNPANAPAYLPGCHNNTPATATGCGDCAFVFVPSVKGCVACIRENQTQRITKDMVAVMSPPAEWCATTTAAATAAATVAASKAAAGSEPATTTAAPGDASAAAKAVAYAAAKAYAAARCTYDLTKDGCAELKEAKSEADAKVADLALGSSPMYTLIGAGYCATAAGKTPPSRTKSDVGTVRDSDGSVLYFEMAACKATCSGVVACTAFLYDYKDGDCYLYGEHMAVSTDPALDGWEYSPMATNAVVTNGDYTVTKVFKNQGWTCWAKNATAAYTAAGCDTDAAKDGCAELKTAKDAADAKVADLAGGSGALGLAASIAGVLVGAIAAMFF